MPDGDAGNSLVLTRVVMEAFADSNWPVLRDLCHEDALLSTLAAQLEVMTPDELMLVLAEVTAGDVYGIDGMTATAVDETAALLTGRIRFPLAAGGFGEGDRAWLLTYRDGLLYRLRAYTSARKARAAYAEHGPRLGIENAAEHALH